MSRLLDGCYQKPARRLYLASGAPTMQPRTYTAMQRHIATLLNPLAWLLSCALDAQPRGAPIQLRHKKQYSEVRFCFAV